MTESIELNKIQESLRTVLLGRTIIFDREVDSTNEWAKRLAIDGAREGTVVLAETQKKGRGRYDRRWVSPKGGLWLSLILRPKLHPSETIRLNFVAGLAVAKVLRSLFNLKAETMWPNDVLVNGLKICGVISEMNSTNGNVNFVVLGIGINLNFDVEKALPERLRKTATAVESELGRKVQLEKVIKGLLESLEDLYKVFTKKGFGPILQEWKKHAGFIGRRVEVRDLTRRVTGLALDVDHEGALLLELDNRTVTRLFVGDIIVRTQ